MIELNTILIEVEAVLNSRPLAYPYVDTNLPSSCTAFSQAFAVNWFRWRISDERPGVA